MNQADALAGPPLFAYMLLHYDYPKAFLIFLIPGTLVMIFVFTAWSFYPKIKSDEFSPKKFSFRGVGRRFWLYVLSMTLRFLGFVHRAIASVSNIMMNIHVTSNSAPGNLEGGLMVTALELGVLVPEDLSINYW